MAITSYDLLPTTYTITGVAFSQETTYPLTVDLGALNFSGGTAGNALTFLLHPVGTYPIIPEELSLTTQVEMDAEI